MAIQSKHPARLLTHSRRPAVWLTIAVVATAVVWTAYVLTHGHPAYEGGLYLQTVEEIRRHGYRLPGRIPYYTAGGIPFAYPPFAFYALAALVDLTGVDPVWLMRVLPGLLVVAYLLPYYAIAEELLATPRRAGFATLVFGVAPPVLQWHLSSGGVVRGLATLLTLTGVYTGLRLFRTGGRTWLAASTLLWALVVLTHPVYTVFFGWTYLLLYAATDRSLAGLLRGATVAGGGLVIAAPWWVLVASRHGFGVFVAALDSRSSLGGTAYRIYSQFLWPVVDVDAVTAFYVLAFAGTVYAVYRRRFFLPVWLVSASYLIGKQRFTFVAGAMLAALFVFDVVVPAAARAGAAVDRERLVAVGAIVVLVVGSTGVGAAYAGSGLQTAHESSDTMPETVDPADREAMEWAQTHTRPSADFLVLGDTAEWFPYYSERTILVSPWGTEWTDHFREEVQRYLSMSTCEDLACLEAKMQAAHGTPDYVYVSANEYTVRGQEYSAQHALILDMVRSSDYDLQYANRGVLVFEVESTASEPVSDRPSAPRFAPPWTDGHRRAV